MPIIKATATDVSTLVALVNSAYRGETSRRGWTTESHLLDGIRIDEQEMQSYFQNPKITMLKYVADEGEVIGCVYLEQVKGNRLYLGMLTVKPTVQAQGTGRQLLQAAEAYAQELQCSAIKISVLPMRSELVAWYNRRGYTATGQILPFPSDTRFGTPRQPLELMVMEKPVD